MNLVIVGHFPFPTGSAAASRMRHFAQGFAERGHRVWIIALTPGRAAPGAVMEGAWVLWQGVRYTQAGGWADPESSAGRLRRFARGLADMQRDGKHACGLLDHVHASARIDLVIGYSVYQLGLGQIAAHCAARHIPLVHDVVEWFSPESFTGGRCNPLYWDSMRAFHFMLPRADGIIAISSFLERWFTSKGLPTVRIPAIIDPGEPAAEQPVADAARRPFALTYLGNMNDRDGPRLMIDAIRLAVADGHDVVFNVVGATERIPAAQRAKAMSESDPLLRGRIVFWGRVPDEDVKRHLRDSDALIFTRLPGRAAQAAFPTRLPEYLLAGRPVIASDVSDIGEYLKAGRDALLVRPDSPPALAEAIVELIRMPDRGRAIGLAGRQRCGECFHFRPRAQQMLEFFEHEILAPGRRAFTASMPT